MVYEKMADDASTSAGVCGASGCSGRGMDHMAVAGPPLKQCGAAALAFQRPQRHWPWRRVPRGWVVDTAATFTTPMQCALMLSGAVLVLLWRPLVGRFAAFELLGAWALVHVCAIFAAAVGGGTAASSFLRRNKALQDWLVSPLTLLLGPLSAMPVSPALPRGASKGGKGLGDAVAGPGSGKGAPTGHALASTAGAVRQQLHAQLPPQQEEDDVTAQKRHAQAAAAQLAASKAQVQQLLGSIEGASMADAAHALHQVAQALFAAAAPAGDIVQADGLQAVVALLPRCSKQLASGQQAADASPALLQACWVLLLVANGSAACRKLLSASSPLPALAGAMRIALDAERLAPSAREAILRSSTWTAALLCRTAAAATSDEGSTSQQQSGVEEGDDEQGGGAVAAAALEQLLDMGGVECAARAMAMYAGSSAAWSAAALLACAADPSGYAPERVRGAAIQVALHPEALRGLCHLLQMRSGAVPASAATAVPALAAALLDAEPEALLQGLVEERLMGRWLAALPQRLAHLTMCTLLSSRGQQVLATVEGAYELDVPLALAQAIPAEHAHVKLPVRAAAAAAPASLGGDGADAAAGDEDAAVGPSAAVAAAARADTYTDMLACRLLLQHRRLHELVSAFCEEMQAAAVTQQVEASGAGQGPEESDGSDGSTHGAMAATAALCAHLLARESELEMQRRLCGASVASGSEGSVASSMASSASTLSAALAAPDVAGVYRRLMAGLVPAQQLPALASLCEIEPLEEGPSSSGASGAGPFLRSGAQASSSGSGQHVFRYGAHEHRVSGSTLRRMRQESKLVGQLLAGVDSSGGVISLLAVPQFTDEANAWVARCLAGWADMRALPEGFGAQRAAQLWVAADFLQADGLQMACDDCMAAALGPQDPALFTLVLELCSRHPRGSTRLLRLTTLAFMRALHAAGAAAEALAAAVAAQLQLLGGCLLVELRDRLVALVTLNAGLDADTPEDPVE